VRKLKDLRGRRDPLAHTRYSKMIEAFYFESLECAASFALRGPSASSGSGKRRPDLSCRTTTPAYRARGSAAWVLFTINCSQTEHKGKLVRCVAGEIFDVAGRHPAALATFEWRLVSALSARIPNLLVDTPALPWFSHPTSPSATFLI